MKKSVYSILLSDEIIKQIDRLAYANSMSRSAMINNILAEFLSLETPEQKLKNIYGYIEKHFEGYSSFQKAFSSSDSMLTINSALEYKYNPTIRYKIVLHKVYGEAVGQIKICARTKSKNLIDDLNAFYEIWQSIENNFSAFNNGVLLAEMKQSSYIRYLSQGENDYSDESLAEAIALYIRTTDKALKLYFNNKEKKDIYELIATIYKKYIYEIESDQLQEDKNI